MVFVLVAVVLCIDGAAKGAVCARHGAVGVQRGSDGKGIMKMRKSGHTESHPRSLRNIECTRRNAQRIVGMYIKRYASDECNLCSVAHGVHK